MLPPPKYHFSIPRQSDLLAAIDIWERAQKGVYEKGHVHAYYEILIFRKGGGTHQMGDDVFKVDDHSIHVLEPNKCHELKRTTQTDGFEIIFSEAFLQQLQQFDRKTNYLQYFSQSHVLNLSAEQFREFEVYFGELVKDKESKSLFNNWVALILLKILQSDVGRTRLPASSEFEKDVLSLLRKNYQHRPTAEFYASSLNMSAATFQRRMKATFGRSIIELQAEKIIQDVKALLSQSEKPIKQISSDYNFSDEPHFTHFFKNHVGISPTAFRRGVMS